MRQLRANLEDDSIPQPERDKCRKLIYLLSSRINEIRDDETGEVIMEMNWYIRSCQNLTSQLLFALKRQQNTIEQLNREIKESNINKMV